MDKDNLGYAFARYGMDILYLCEEMLVQICRLLGAIMKRKKERRQW